MSGIGLSQQRLVQLIHRIVPAALGDLHERGRVRHGVIGPDPAKAPPPERVGHLFAQRLEAEAVAKAEVHEPQVRLDRDRRPAQAWIEVRHERLEEDRVVQQVVDGRKPRRKAAELVGQH